MSVLPTSGSATVRFWSPLPALVALGVASAYYFATRHLLAVTGEFTRWGGTSFPVRLRTRGVELLG